MATKTNGIYKVKELIRLTYQRQPIALYIWISIPRENENMSF